MLHNRFGRSRGLARLGLHTRGRAGFGFGGSRRLAHARGRGHGARLAGAGLTFSRGRRLRHACWVRHGRRFGRSPGGCLRYFSGHRLR